jgi:hypothetical protein
VPLLYLIPVKYKSCPTFGVRSRAYSLDSIVFPSRVVVMQREGEVCSNEMACSRFVSNAKAIHVVLSRPLSFE